LSYIFAVPITPPRILVAPDKFKGSLPAVDVCAALERGLVSGGRLARVTTLPLADGGDGTLDAVLRSGFEAHTIQAVDALGRPRTCRIGVRGTSAVVELAEVCGLATVSDRPFEPLRATTRGLGLAILAALDLGCTDVVVAIGGSASTDGGAGMLAALGASLLDAEGRAVHPVPHELGDIVRLDLSTLDSRLEHTRLRFAVDVDAPLTGRRGAAAVFGPQKGASPADVAELDAALSTWGALRPALDPDTPGAGAAGGVGYGALMLGAELVSGADRFLAMAGLDLALEDVDLVITGEGRLDRQTLMGKGPGVVAQRAREAGIPVVAVVGQRSPELRDEELLAAGIGSVYALVDRRAEAARDPQLSRALLVEIGHEIATSIQSHLNRSAEERTEEGAGAR
jgi:glycerate kinase